MVSLGPDRIKHLEFVQATIARQASHSFAVKGWSLTVSAALFAFTSANLTIWMAIVAVLPPLAFAYLDAFYLRQERLFRQLFTESVATDSAIGNFEMSTLRFSEGGEFPACKFGGKKGVLRSNPWRLFHGMILAVGLVLLGVAVFQALGPAELPDIVGDAL